MLWSELKDTQNSTCLSPPPFSLFLQYKSRYFFFPLDSKKYRIGTAHRDTNSQHNWAEDNRCPWMLRGWFRNEPISNAFSCHVLLEGTYQIEKTHLIKIFNIRSFLFFQRNCRKRWKLHWSTTDFWFCWRSGLLHRLYLSGPEQIWIPSTANKGQAGR